MFKFEEQLFVERRSKSHSSDSYLLQLNSPRKTGENVSPRSFSCKGDTEEEAIKNLKRCVEGSLLTEVDNSIIEGMLFIGESGVFKVNVVKIPYTGRYEASVTI
jgi:hypothetical protein